MGSGRLVLTASRDTTVRVWQVEHEEGLCIATMHGSRGPITSAVFSPCGLYVATSSTDFRARVWLVTAGLCCQVFSGHESQVNSVQFSASGEEVLTASSDGTSRIWSVSTGACLWVLHAET